MLGINSPPVPVRITISPDPAQPGKKASTDSVWSCAVNVNGPPLRWNWATSTPWVSRVSFMPRRRRNKRVPSFPWEFLQNHPLLLLDDTILDLVAKISTQPPSWALPIPHRQRAGCRNEAASCGEPGLQRFHSALPYLF
jgi:hypothetical protein